MDKLCTISQIANWCGVTKHVIAGWIRHKGLYVRRVVGRRQFLCKSDVNRFLEQQNAARSK